MLTREFGIAEGRVSSYQDSYHGLASKLGSKVVANCASCHGVHKILPSSDPRSTINRAQLVATCGKCHPGAGTRFAIGTIHIGEGGEEPAAELPVEAGDALPADPVDFALAGTDDAGDDLGDESRDADGDPDAAVVTGPDADLLGDDEDAGAHDAFD
jgi:hypothetical protein